MANPEISAQPALATILVIDDNATNLKLTCAVLRSEGYEVVPVRNAVQAQEALQQPLPALILMDIQMPGMDGLTLTRQLKADALTRAIPIVAMTSFAMKGDEAKARAAGCDGYITKPIDTRKLPGRVAAVLQRPTPGVPSLISIAKAGP
jgi:CheY-like chemotaxis protein